MRPVSISLEGFLSYREPTTVDLEGIPAAAIVGPNGAGKTSLVEAVLWCLFGEGRGRGPDDYVSVGAASCSVSFVFELDGQRYRVDRGRQRGRQAKSQLGLFALRDGVWTPVGGDSIAETQAAIERLVGLSAETWLRCSYLAQNQIDAFTRLRPAERKALLAEVLGISRYEALAERARAHERELAGELGATDRRAEELEALLAGEPAARAALEAARRMLADAEAGRERAEAEAARARVALDEARAAVAGLEEARRRLEELRARLEESRSRAEAERRRLRREAEDVAG
ncbi:MAG TPA: SMC family ATPase, partial [Actinomycetota bacterium]|nr:SMC family ATPase [Actinomycetota bacterium]